MVSGKYADEAHPYFSAFANEHREELEEDFEYLDDSSEKKHFYEFHDFKFGRREAWQEREKLELAVFEKLIANGCDVNIKNKYGVTPLMLAIHYGREEFIRTLLEVGADYTARDNRDNSVDAYVSDYGVNIGMEYQHRFYGAEQECKVLWERVFTEFKQKQLDEVAGSPAAEEHVLVL